MRRHCGFRRLIKSGVALRWPPHSMLRLRRSMCGKPLAFRRVPFLEGGCASGGEENHQTGIAVSPAHGVS
jgi:hypothetical protein